MSQKTLILLTFLAVGLLPAFGQVQTQPPLPATQEQIQNLEQKLERFRRDQQKALDDAATRSETEKKAITDRYESTIKSYQQALDQLRDEQRKTQESVERQAREAEEVSRMRTERITRLFFGTLTGLLLIGSVILLVHLRNKKNLLQKPLVNPEVPTLRQIAASRQDKKVLFLLELEGNRQFMCEVFFEDLNNQPQVRFIESGITCRWDRRKQTAETLKPRVA